MIKFKEHDGLLFKMLDKPVPLKENDENVLVRFITHGVIGEYVMAHWLDCNQKNEPIYVDNVDSDGDVTVWIDENRNSHHCCPFPMFEIIGTFVEEGSADWALYQMMQGNIVCQKDRLIKRHYEAGYVRWVMLYNEKISQRLPADVFLKYFADTMDWQIYEEPKPTFKVGDWVKYDIDTYLQVTEASGVERTWCKTLSGIAVYPYTSCLSKIDPSEVKVKFELIGKVRKIEGNNRAFELIDEDGVATVIGWQQIKNPTTRSLVESLLKAQEEE